jgi:hypothetical protein
VQYDVQDRAALQGKSANNHPTGGFTQALNNPKTLFHLHLRQIHPAAKQEHAA